MRILHPRSRNARRGGVLALSLVAVGVVTILSVGFLRLSAHVTRRQVGAVDGKLAFYLSEAGLSEAYSGIMVGHTGNIGSMADPAILGEGLFWVEATALDTEHLQLRSTGMAKGGTATLGLVIRKGRTNLGALGMFSEQDLSLEGGTLVDGYNSEDGDYATQLAADPGSVQKGRITSDGSVTIDATAGPTAMHGDAFAGGAGTVNLINSPTVTGVSEVRPVDVVLDPVEVPDITLGTGLTHGAGPPMVVPSGKYGARFLQLGVDADMVLQGPMLLVVDGMTLAAGSELTLDTTGGPIVMYVSNLADVEPGAAMTNTSGDPTRARLNIAGPATATLEGDGPFHGLLYAPETTLLLGSDFELFGAAVAQDLDVAPGAQLHYDRKLSEAGARDALPSVVSWRIISMPVEHSALRRNPFDTLGLDPALLRAPIDAHEDQNIDVAYRDAGNAPRTYSGLESAFDWGAVRSVDSLVRTGGLMDKDVVQVARDGGLGITVQ